MSPRRCMSSRKYLAMFNAVKPLEEEFQEISDAESRVGDRPCEDSREEVPLVVPRVGWTAVRQLRFQKDNAFVHERLEYILFMYYKSWKAKLEYHTVEYSHPTERSEWDACLQVKYLNPNTKTYQHESYHYSPVPRPTVELSMEDAAFQALTCYLGRRHDDNNGQLRDVLKHYPRYVKNQARWVIDGVEDSSSTLQATVGLTGMLLNNLESMGHEMLRDKLTIQRQHEEIIRLKAQQDPTP